MATTDPVVPWSLDRRPEGLPRRISAPGICEAPSLPWDSQKLAESHGILPEAKGCFLKWCYPNSWMVYFMENPIYKWMMTGGTPILGHHYFFFFNVMFKHHINHISGVTRHLLNILNSPSMVPVRKGLAIAGWMAAPSSAASNPATFTHPMTFCPQSLQDIICFPPHFFFASWSNFPKTYYIILHLHLILALRCFTGVLLRLRGLRAHPLFLL